jgi:CO/xanthine dehydrogenase Mo-binding subunit
VPEPLIRPAFHDQPVLALDKVRYVGEPVAVVLAPTRTSRRGGGAPHTAEYERCRRCTTSRGGELEGDRARDAEPAGHLSRSEASQGKDEHQSSRSISICAAATRRALAKARRVFEHRFRTQQVMHTPLEPLVSAAESTESSLTIHTASQSPSFVAHRDRAPARLAREPVRVRVPFLGGGFGAEALHQARGAGRVLSLMTRSR